MRLAPVLPSVHATDNTTPASATGERGGESHAGCGYLAARARDARRGGGGGTDGPAGAAAGARPSGRGGGHPRLTRPRPRPFGAGPALPVAAIPLLPH